MALIERLEQIVPRWMIEVPRAHFSRLMSGPAALLDALGEGAYQARTAALPGQTHQGDIPGLGGYDNVDALFLLARDRLVMPIDIGAGTPWVTEKPWDLAARLRAWRDDWTNNVGAFGLLDQLAYALVPDVPVLRFVQRGGGVTSWYTRQPDGVRRLQRSDGKGFAFLADGSIVTDSTVAQAWNWDDSSVPATPDQGDDGRGWLIFYPPAATPYITATDGTFTDPGVVDDAWNDPGAQVNGQPTAGTIGTNAPVGMVAVVINVMAQRHTMGARVPWAIAAFDPLSFSPDGSSLTLTSRTSYPDGQWGWHTTPGTVGGAPTRVIARLQTAEYWRISGAVATPTTV